ncbi:MAG TPA: hypothetical protein DGT23_19940 [Micromonosporaceae bacterium]|nr:hypothetical protein [Micromonosporaceae bacterium]
MTTDIVPAGRAVRLAATLVPLGLGVACLLYSLSLKVGTPTAPEPGFWPAIVSCLLLVSSIWLLVSGHGKDECESFTRSSLGIAFGVASLVAFVLLFNVIGFELACVGLFVFWLKVLGRESWKVTVLTSVGFTAVFHVLFIELLGAPLPRLIG